MSPTEQQFWSRVNVGNSPAGCWTWTGYVDPNGYARLGRRRAHRLAYELLVGLIPAGYHVDHLCRERDCVNPLHLEAVTPGENSRRGNIGQVWGASQRAKTHCPAGHPYSGDNLRVNPQGKRLCRACGNEWYRKNRAKETHVTAAH